MSGSNGEGTLRKDGAGSLAGRLCAGLIVVYQRAVSPLLPPACRYVPSCSEYARQALLRHGLVHGGLLTLKRVCRCHPLLPGGYDPVPGEGREA